MANNLYFTTAGMVGIRECKKDMLKGLVLHHSAWHAGYVPHNKKCSGMLLEPYHGRFGDGYKLHVHSTCSLRFHIVAYLVK